MIYFRPLLSQSLFALGAFVWLCWLGVWQLDRLAWKLDLIEIAQERAHGDPLVLQDVLARPTLEDMRYQKVIVTGTFDHANEVFVYAPHRLGQGFRVITPFIPLAGSPVLVDRGWVPNALRAATARPAGQVEGEVSLQGLIILGGEATLGVAGHQDGDPVWMYRDLEGMADYIGMEALAPVFIEALPAQGGAPWPRPEVPDLSFRNSHLSYALTWFGLAFALLCVYIAFHVSQGRLGIAKPGEG